MPGGCRRRLCREGQPEPTDQRTMEAVIHTETITRDGWSFYSDRVKIPVPDEPFATVEAAQAAAEADYRGRNPQTCNCPDGCFWWRASRDEPVHYWLERHGVFVGHTVFPASEGLR